MGEIRANYTIRFSKQISDTVSTLNKIQTKKNEGFFRSDAGCRRNIDLLFFAPNRELSFTYFWVG